MDLYDDLSAKTKELDYKIKELSTNGAKLALAERNYKIKLRLECLKLRDEGMAIGMIDKTCYGIPEIADLRYKRDIAKTIYQSNLESINTIKLQMRILENQISREWGNSGSNNY